MDIGKDYLKKFKVVGKKAEKSRWDWCVDVAKMTSKPVIVISTLLKGLTGEQIAGFYNKAKESSRPDIEFWKVWKDNKPK